MSQDLLLRAARLPAAIPGAPEPLQDVLLQGGLVAHIAPGIDPASLPAGARVVDLGGRWLRPGLWDSHVHFGHWVVRRSRLDLAPAASAAHTLAIVRDALPTHPAEILVGYGFRDGLWPDAPSLAALDELAPERPVVLISGDLHCGWLNSAAARLLGVAPPDDGVLREGPWITTLEHLDRRTPPSVADYRAAADAAAARGVVGIVELENADNATEWPRRTDSGVTALRVETSVWPDRLDAAIAAGLRTGDVLDREGLVTMGQLKVVADGSLNTRTAFCWDPYPGLPAGDPHSYGIESVPHDMIAAVIARALDAGIRSTVHAIGDRANSQALDVFEQLGVAGTVEHAQLVAASDLARFGALGITASVQPEHAMDDRDVADRYWPGRTDRAFAFRSLLDAGAQLALGSDAPVAPLDPWITIAAAVSRSRDGREPWHPEQCLTRTEALAASARGRLSVEPGQVADLMVLDADPFTSDAAHLRAMPVAATLVGGRFTCSNLED